MHCKKGLSTVKKEHIIKMLIKLPVYRIGKGENARVPESGTSPFKLRLAELEEL